MSPFVVSIAFLACLSVAYADVSHLNGGYHYPNFGLSALHTPDQPPHTQYHATYGDNLLTSNLPNSYAPIPSGSPFNSVAPLPQTYAPLRLSAPLQSPLLAGQKYQSQTNYQQTQQQPQYQQQTRTYQPQPLQRQAYQAPAYQTPTTYQAQTQGTTSNAYSQQQVQNQEPIITKHFYVHAAPEDPEENAPPRYVQLGRPRKNYKIIFIKAPTYSTHSQIIPIVPQNEDKTIVYVLSKKPTYEANVEIPEPPVTEPSKPDVFFIKYKNQQEAEQAQQSIQAAYDQANLSNAGTADQIASQFVTDNDSGSSTAFGGQDFSQGGQSSANQVKRSVQRRF